MVTIYDIAKKLNINASTVSRAMSKPELVSAKTRKRVLEAAEELGYMPNMIASQLRSQDSSIIALISLEPVWSWYTDRVLNGAEEKVREYGYSIVALSSNIKSYMENIQFCEQMRFAGVILFSAEIGYNDETVESNIPIVYINRRNVSSRIILPDEAYGIQLAFDYLVSMGHSKIGMISGSALSIHSHMRHDAYAQLMKSKGYPIIKKWCGEAHDWRKEETYEIACRIFRQNELPTALLVGDDLMCTGVYKAAREFGLKVGKDISVVGYNDDDRAEYMDPALTTVQFPLYEMGVQAVTMLVSVIRGQLYQESVMVRGKLIIRDSVGQVENGNK